MIFFTECSVLLILFVTSLIGVVSWPSSKNSQSEKSHKHHGHHVMELDQPTAGDVLAHRLKKSFKVAAGGTFFHGTRKPSEDPLHPTAMYFEYESYLISDRVQNRTQNLIRPSNKYYLTAVSMFKNEAGIAKEWLDHHIAHGFEHFYLHDDGSTDNIMPILEPYIKKGYVTMRRPPSKEVKFRQNAAYKQAISSIIEKNESRWVAFIDMDEFMWSPETIDLRIVLSEHEKEGLSVARLAWLWFGSNGHITQPKSVVHSFTMRADMTKIKSNTNVTSTYKVLLFDNHKNIVNTQYKIVDVNVHEVRSEGYHETLSTSFFPGDKTVFLNHYSVQSKEFFLKNKGARGSANGFYKVEDRNLQWFESCDLNEIKDDRLAKQNRAWCRYNDCS